jgi:hypothetical protein
VVAIDFQVISQFVPFIRLDGYWVLADLTGLPDPLSQIRPFLARMLGLPALSADKLPRLRSWVTWVFAVYIALTVPLLAFLLAMMLKGFPEYAAGTWAAFTYQIQILGILFAFRLYAEVAIVVINFFLLALPFVGTLYIFFGSAQWGLGILRRWSGPSPFRRAACTMGAIAVLATLGYVWTPGLTLIAEGAPAGVESFPAEHQAIVQTDVVYPQSPPAGGDHWSDWLNCGYYPTPVRNENAVDSLARGAVWVTYRPDLPPDQVASLRQLAHREGDLIVSPYPGLQAPIVASAWGRQLPLQSVTDPRLVQFVRAYQDGRQAPQPTPTCNGGVGHPD